MLYQNIIYSNIATLARTAFATCVAFAFSLTSNAQVVTFSDATFHNDAWSTIKVADTTPQHDATGVSSQDLSNGNSPPCRITVHNWEVTGPGVSIAFAHLRQDAVWNSALRGPIVNIDYSFSARCFSAPLVNAVGFTLFLKQGNDYFTAPGVAVFAEQPWQVFSGSIAPHLLYPWTDNLNQQPDFSASAPPIEFGYYSGNGGSGASLRNTATAAIDNWIVAVTACLAVSTQPVSTTTCPSSNPSFSVEIAGNGPLVFQWRKNSLPISLESNPSAATATLVLPNVQLLDAGSYDCTISNSCGTVITNPATLSVCPANFNCDNAVDFFDYLDFVDAFASSSSGADFNHDGIIDFFDYLDFVDVFSAGC